MKYNSPAELCNLIVNKLIILCCYRKITDYFVTKPGKSPVDLAMADDDESDQFHTPSAEVKLISRSSPLPFIKNNSSPQARSITRSTAVMNSSDLEGDDAAETASKRQKPLSNAPIVLISDDEDISELPQVEIIIRTPRKHGSSMPIDSSSSSSNSNTISTASTQSNLHAMDSDDELPSMPAINKPKSVPKTSRLIKGSDIRPTLQLSDDSDDDLEQGHLFRSTAPSAKKISSEFSLDKMMKAKSKQTVSALADIEELEKEITQKYSVMSDGNLPFSDPDLKSEVLESVGGMAAVDSDESSVLLRRPVIYTVDPSARLKFDIPIPPLSGNVSFDLKQIRAKSGGFDVQENALIQTLQSLNVSSRPSVPSSDVLDVGLILENIKVLSEVLRKPSSVLVKTRALVTLVLVALDNRLSICGHEVFDLTQRICESFDEADCKVIGL